MDGEERQQKIESYGHAFMKLKDALSQMPREMWQFKPSPEVWSIQEIIVHIADSEANSYVRLRKCVAEPGETVMAYDGDQWARLLNYQEQESDIYLELFHWLRFINYRLIESLDEGAWSNTMQHPEFGTQTLDDWLTTYESHIPEHIQEMWALYSRWIEEHW